MILQKDIIEKWQVDREEANVMLEKLLLGNDVRTISEVTKLISDKTFRWSLYLPQDMRNDLLNTDLPIDISIDFGFSIPSLNKVSLEERKKQICDSTGKLIAHCRDVMNKMVKDLSGELGKDTNNILCSDLKLLLLKIHTKVYIIRAGVVLDGILLINCKKLYKFKY